MRLNEMKVSIIIPIYNVQNYLEECLESVVRQSYKNLEIILIDDGSTDNSGKIADQYAKNDKRIKVVHKKNEGVSIARNVGIDMATGEYVCFADADDCLMEDYVEYLLKLILANNSDIALTKEMFTTFHRKQVKEDMIENYSAEKTTYEILIYNIPIGVYCKMFRRTFLNKNKIRFLPNIFIGEGFNFNTMAFQRANNVAIGHKKIYFYRRNNPTSATTKFSMKKWDNALFAIENIKRDLLINNNYINTAWKYANWHTTCDAFNFMVIAKAEKQNKDTYRRYKTIVRKDAIYAFKVSIKPKEKIRSILFIIYPRLVPRLISIRNRKYSTS